MKERTKKTLQIVIGHHVVMGPILKKDLEENDMGLP